MSAEKRLDDSFGKWKMSDSEWKAIEKEPKKAWKKWEQSIKELKTEEW